MVDIVRSYLQGAQNPLQTLCHIFENVSGGDRFSKLMETEKETQNHNEISVSMVFQLLRYINHAKTDRIFTAELIESIKFGDTVISIFPVSL